MDKSVLFLMNGWDSAAGGIQTVNRELILALARTRTDLTCVALVTSATDAETDHALRNNVTLIRGEALNDWSSAVLSKELSAIRPADVLAVVGHSYFSGDEAFRVRERFFPEALVVHFIHMNPMRVEGAKEQKKDNYVTEREAKLKREFGISKKADLVFCVGPRLFRYARDLFASHGEEIGRIHRLDCGFSNEVQPERVPPIEPTVLCLGRTESLGVKGLDIFGYTAGLLQTAWMTNPLTRERSVKPKFVVRGAEKEPEALEARLKTFAGEVGTNANIMVRPYTVDKRDLRADLRGASVFLMPSREEGFGLVACEALSLGTPIIVSAESGMAELIQEVGRDSSLAFDSCIIEVNDDAMATAQRFCDATFPLLADPGADNLFYSKLREHLLPISSWESGAHQFIKTVEEGRRANNGSIVDSSIPNNALSKIFHKSTIKSISPTIFGFPCKIVTYDLELPKSELLTKLRDGFDIFVDVDIGSLNDRADVNEYFSSIASHINLAIEDDPLAPQVYREAYTRISSALASLRPFRDTAFELGGTHNMLAALKRMVDGDEAARGSTRTRAAQRLVGTLDIEECLDYGRALLRAAIGDVLALAGRKTSRTALCFHGMAAFPAGLLEFVVAAIDLQHLPQNVEIVIAGQLRPTTAHTWPDGRVHLAADEVPTSPSDFIDAMVLANRSHEIGFSIRDLEMVVAVANCNSRMIWEQACGMGADLARSVVVALEPRFGRDTPIDAAWRRHFLSNCPSHICMELLSRLKIVEWDADRDEPGLLGVAILRAAAQCVATGLDTFIANYIRGDLRRLEALRVSLHLLADSPALADAPGRGLLDRYVQLVIALSKSEFDSGVVASYWAGLCQQSSVKVSSRILSIAHYQLGYAHYVENRSEEARETLARAVELDPANFRAWNLLGSLALAVDELSAAETFFDRAIEENANYGFAYYNQGLLFRRKKALVDAAISYVRAIQAERDNGFYEAMFNLSNVLLDLRCYSDAARITVLGAHLGEAARGEMECNLGIALIGGGYAELGIKLLLDNSRRRPSPHALYCVAVGRFLRGETNEANACVKQLVDEIPPPHLAEEVRQLAEDLATGVLPPRPNLDQKPVTARGLRIPVDELIANIAAVGAMPTLYPLVRNVQAAVEKPPRSPLRHADAEVRAAFKRGFHKPLTDQEREMGRQKRQLRHEEELRSRMTGKIDAAISNNPRHPQVALQQLMAAELRIKRKSRPRRRHWSLESPSEIWTQVVRTYRLPDFSGR